MLQEQRNKVVEVGMMNLIFLDQDLRNFFIRSEWSMDGFDRE